MIITLSPTRMGQTLTVELTGSILWLNGTGIDLSSYEEENNPNIWVIGQPINENGVWYLTLILPHGADAPEETRFPQKLVVNGDGPIQLPAYEADKTPEIGEN